MKFSPKNPIPPGSKLKVVKTVECHEDLGRCFTVGFYGVRDGLDVIWLVNEKGEYEQTTDHESIGDLFEIVLLSRNRDYYGKDTPAGQMPLLE